MRADVFLVTHGYAQSREAARKSIEASLVTVDGKLIGKPSESVDENTTHVVDYRRSIPYVSRGGLKLEKALDEFGINVSGYVCIDIGASTGGFTDCLLKRGASKVYAVDSGHGQLSPFLASDERVVSLEGVNARELPPSLIGELCDIAVMDVSFISQTYILPVIPPVLKENGIAVTLIKPQFEAGRSGVGKGGIVKDPEVRKNAVKRVIECAAACGLFASELTVSSITGGDGNREFLVCFRKDKHFYDPDVMKKIRF